MRSTATASRASSGRPCSSCSRGGRGRSASTCSGSARSADSPTAACPRADLVVAADGVDSVDPRAAAPTQFEPQIDWRRNRFVWLGTTLPVPRLHLLLQGDARRPLARARLSVRRRATRRSSSRHARRPGRRAGSTRTTRARPSPICEELFARRAAGPPAARRTAPSGAASRPSATRAGTTATSCCWATPPTRRTSRSARAPSWRWRTPSRSRRRCRRHGDLPTALAAYEAEPPAAGRDACSARRRRASSGSSRRSATTTTRAAPVRLQPADAQPAHHPREPEAARSRARRAGGPLVRRAGRRGRAACRVADPAPAAACSRRSGCAELRAAEPRRGLADVPVLGGGRHCRTTGTSSTSAAGRSAARGW